MTFKDKLKKIKNKLKNNKSFMSLNYLSNEEKTGVITGLVILGAAWSYLLSQSSETEASSCLSGWNNNTSLNHIDRWSNWDNWKDWCSWSQWSSN